MKRVIFIFTFCIAFYSCKAQEGLILPLKTSPLDYPSGIYKKDLDNVFLNYIGTWESIWSGKTFQLTIEKIPQHLITYPDGSYYYRDLLIGKYIVKDNATNVELFNTMAISNPEIANVTSIGSGQNNKMHFLFNESLCDINGEFYLIRDLTNPNIMQYQFKPYQEFWFPKPECPYSSISEVPFPLPKVNLTLTRL